jgi:hypothetical protein
MESSSSGNGCIADPLNVSVIPDTLANDLLVKLEKSISDLLKMLPNVSETDKIAIFAQDIPTDMDGDDAWEFFLDPLLNRFLGFGRLIKSIFMLLRGGENGLTAMA